MIDDYRNLIYIHKYKHKDISRRGNRNVVLSINPNEAVFSDFENRERVKTTNDKEALYTRKQTRIDKISKYNARLLQSLFEFTQPH